MICRTKCAWLLAFRTKYNYSQNQDLTAILHARDWVKIVAYGLTGILAIENDMESHMKHCKTRLSSLYENTARAAHHSSRDCKNLGRALQCASTEYKTEKVATVSILDDSAAMANSGLTPFLETHK